ncbi:MAG: toxin-antitoxin system HicB family antitoxin [Planctomycetota bacterium]
MTNVTVDEFKERCQQVLETARSLHASKPDWVTFFRETLGVDGAARSVFAMQEEYLQFEKTKEHEMIKSMVANLRSRKAKKAREEDTKVITVRLPESLHEALKAEAAEHRTSMNKLCISKLLQVLVEQSEAEALENRAAENRAAENRTTDNGQSNRGFRSSIDPS